MLFRIEYINLDKNYTEITFVRAYNLDHAFQFIEEVLDEEIGEEKYAILHIKTKINFLDAIEEVESHFHWTGSCPCPQCEFDKVELDRRMVFRCPSCNDEIKVADNSWETIQCNQCGFTIVRANLSRDKKTGEWVYSGEIEDNGEEE